MYQFRIIYALVSYVHIKDYINNNVFMRNKWLKLKSIRVKMQ